MLHAPFPWFGGKRKVATDVWRAFGDVRNYVEPFAGSLAIADRLRRVRVASGDWQRVLGPSVTTRHGVTGVFLDPPYPDDQHAVDYVGGSNVSADVYAWAVEHGADPLMRIAFCTYDGAHACPDGWSSHAWKARGGYGSQGNGRGRANSAREVIYFSPACVPLAADVDLFAEVS